ncbi:hypothetical protein CkaCkLH20_00504 [Colletotrichum karsti]|uniref:Uncharacterized protein n=1 Tax=Colletotrichum karsti TaxID=1095194 RepID=A0A9P6IGL5_9PEZI|nr:uncharacterized protein CkaCkLH20_00504 [Colletotrichum karsti]KAF9882468.1 hypothetical protein CkaCkLH20_00504 [Colletotrichum karsti]
MRGGRLLLEAKESSLEKILIAVRAEVKPQAAAAAAPSKKKSRPSFYPIPILNALAVRNFRATQTIPLAVSGRHLPLVYRIASGLASPPHNKALLIFDMEHRFDATRLTCDPADLRHIHVHRPARRAVAGGSSPRITPDRLRELVASVENWMSYGDHHSGDREFWGSIVVGALGAGDVTAAWRGWLRVERAAVNGFPITFGVREAMADREARQEAVDAAPWAASSRWGDFSFTEAHPAASSEETSTETRQT